MNEALQQALNSHAVGRAVPATSRKMRNASFVNYALPPTALAGLAGKKEDFQICTEVVDRVNGRYCSSETTTKTHRCDRLLLERFACVFPLTPFTVDAPTAPAVNNLSQFVY